jgi:hypothetical protein
MSLVEDVFLRIGGQGWLAIADSLPPLGGDFAAFSERVISHVDISYSPFLIYADTEIEESIQPFIEDIEGLLGISIESLPLNEAQYAEVAQPGLFILTGGAASDWINALGTSQLGEALKHALAEGALIIAADGAAASLGSWVLERGAEGEIKGLGWLPGAIVLPWLDDPANSDRVRTILARSEPLYAIGIANGRMFAFGPDGRAELWGAAAPTLTLGVGWR